MNKKNLLVLVGISLVIVSALSYVLLVPKNDSTVKTENTAKDLPLGNPSTESNQVAPGKYVEYSEEVLASTSGTRLLFFHAPWCPQCREIESDLKEASLPENVTILKVDYDSNQALRQKYGVTIQTTFIKLDEKGDKVASYVAYDEPRFSSVQRELLP